MSSSFIGLGIVLVLTISLTCADGFKFTQTPLEQVSVRRTMPVLLNWKYEVDPEDTIKTIGIYFISKVNGSTTNIKGVSPPKSNATLPKVKTLESADHRITNARYRDTGIYYMKVEIVGSGNISSSKSTLTVEDKPMFLVNYPSGSQTVNDNSTMKLSLRLSGVPKPTLMIGWDDKVLKQGLLETDKSAFYLHGVNMEIEPVLRDRCGRTITIYAKNRFGISKKLKAKINVNFKPKEAQNVKTHYANKGARVDVKWDRQESGLCKIGYRVEFINSTKHQVASKIDYDIVSASAVNSKFNNITHVTIRVIKGKQITTGTYQVLSEIPPKVKLGKKKGTKLMWIIIGAVSVCILLIIISIFGLTICFYKKKTAVASSDVKGLLLSNTSETYK